MIPNLGKQRLCKAHQQRKERTIGLGTNSQCYQQGSAQEPVQEWGYVITDIGD